MGNGPRQTRVVLFMVDSLSGSTVLVLQHALLRLASYLALALPAGIEFQIGFCNVLRSLVEAPVTLAVRACEHRRSTDYIRENSRNFCVKINVRSFQRHPFRSLSDRPVLKPIVLTDTAVACTAHGFSDCLQATSNSSISFWHCPHSYRLFLYELSFLFTPQSPRSPG